jgi:hypothetical protein
MASTSAAVRKAPTPSTHWLRCRRAKTCGGSVRSCCSSQARRIQDAHWPREEKYQSASAWASSRISQAMPVLSKPAVPITSIRQVGRLPVADQSESHRPRLRHSAISSQTIQSGRRP